MRSTLLRLLPWTCVLAGALAGCGARAPSKPVAEPPYTVEHVKRDLALPESVVRIRIDNPHGGVAVRQVDQPLVGTYEVIQRIGATPEEPLIALSLDGDTAVLTVAYASDRQGGADRLVGGHRKGRVDLGVFVPKGPRVDITTTYGDVLVRRIANDMTVRTREGRLTAAGAGAMDLATVSGELRAYPTSAKWSTPMRLVTDTGNVLLEVPVSGPVALSARTGGKFTGPFRLAPTALADGRQSVEWRAGSGSQHIDVDSRSGDIHLIEHR
jgi:hypothetical protein